MSLAADATARAALREIIDGDTSTIAITRKILEYLDGESQRCTCRHLFVEHGPATGRCNRCKCEQRHCDGEPTTSLAARLVAAEATVRVHEHTIRSVSTQRDGLRAEVDMLRGVDCGAGGDGPCGACLKCARRQSAIVRMLFECVVVRDSNIDGASPTRTYDLGAVYGRDRNNEQSRFTQGRLEFSVRDRGWLPAIEKGAHLVLALCLPDDSAA